jgi:hypothetical protein
MTARTNSLFAVAAVAATVFAGGAQAVTFNLDVFDSATGFTGPAGTIAVTQTGSGLSVMGSLNAAYEFRFNPNGMPDFMFNTPSPDAAETALSADFMQTTGGSPYGGPGASTLGKWDNAILCTKGKKKLPCQPGFSPGVNPTSISFTLTGLTLAALEANPNTEFGKKVYFATDVVETNGNTGYVGAELTTSSVSEPAAWAFMLVGVGGLGASMRSRRRVLAQAA